MPDDAALLDVEGLAVHFGGLKAVNGATFSVQPGSVPAPFGPKSAVTEPG